jgi:GAF domain-containing protein
VTDQPSPWRLIRDSLQQRSELLRPAGLVARTVPEGNCAHNGPCGCRCARIGRPTITTEGIDEHLTATAAALELAGLVLAGVSYDDVLARASLVAKRTIPGADEVSITMENGRPVTVAFTGQLAADVDESQYDAGYGPCLDAIRLGQTVLVEDLETDPRWPDYTPRALDAGVRSSVSVPLPVDGHHVGGFNVYGLTARAFDQTSITAIEELAAYAGIVLNNAHLYFAATNRTEQLEQAMKSRAVIEQAKGILMGARHCNADEAFSILVKLSQQSGRKLNTVAHALVDQATTGT